MKISGRSIIGFRSAANTGKSFRATNPRTGEPLPVDFTAAGPDELNLAASLAHEAFETYSQLSGREKAKFLRTIAAKIEGAVDAIVERAEQETALPKARLQGETGRTCGQLRLFAQVVEEGSWVTARIDRADANRKPAPKPDLRSMFHALGPVVVFGASNFPLAFSVAGGDTASALAAGNPVIVKGHPAHPGTSDLVGQLVRDSVQECGLPAGVFSLLLDSGTEVGVALVKHPLVKAVGFTGSHQAGRALMDLAAARPEPIPVFAEMSSTNPVFILPGALRENGDSISAGMFGSLTMGAGQFCTKPGLVFLPENADATTFVEKLRNLVTGSGEFHMLTPGIRSAYQSATASRRTDKGVQLLAEKSSAAGSQDEKFSVGAALFEADCESFLQNPDLATEVFGPSTLVVRHPTHSGLLQLARNLGGHLTATIHGTEADLREFGDLIAILKNKVGRLVFNGFPTGVEVSHAMVHGGPYPSTSDGRSTSVGSEAIFRFCRPVCYQGFPESVLPAELQNGNPLAIWRMVDGEMTREPLTC
ncbi:MAG: aldehyde dehydrogenase (NADP(+)) [Candidatus Sulfotelmatobacter sp.]